MKGILKTGQQIDYHHEGSEMIVSDKKLVKNIMINLISNAVKFSEKDSCIHIYSSVNDHTAVVSVKDEGIGISDEDQQHLFSTFFRGKNALNIQGTGLGLHIVRRYLDLIGGNISLKSDLGQGTTITFTIPAKNHNNGENNISN